VIVKKYVTILDKDYSTMLDEDMFIQTYFNDASCETRLKALGCVVDVINKNSYKKVLSLGSGTCVLEKFLKRLVAVDITCLDNNQDKVDVARRFSPDLNIVCGNMRNVTFLDGFDIALFFNSSAILSPSEHVELLNQLRLMDVKTVVDLGGCLRIGRAVKSYLGSFIKKEVPEHHYCHYIKSRGVFDSIYKQARVTGVCRKLVVGGSGQQGVVTCLSL